MIKFRKWIFCLIPVKKRKKPILFFFKRREFKRREFMS